MIYIATLETAAGTLRAVWSGGTYINLYEGDDDTVRDVINVWDFATDQPTIPINAEAMARHVRAWFWEMERGIEIERITCSTTIELDPTE